jgi:hypothetical protein
VGGVLAEVERPTVDDDAGDDGAVAAEELRGRVHDDVRAVLEGPEQVRRRDGVVDDERDAAGMCDVRHARDVEHVGPGVAEGLGEESPRVRPNRGLPLLEVVRVVDERHLDPELGERVVEQVVGAAVEARTGDDVVTGGSQREQRESLGRLPARHRDRGDTALESRDPLLDHGLGRVHDPAVDVAGLGEGEQVGRVLGVPERERRRLVDRGRAGSRGGVGRGTGVHLLGLERPGGGVLTG